MRNDGDKSIILIRIYIKNIRDRPSSIISNFVTLSRHYLYYKNFQDHPLLVNNKLPMLCEIQHKLDGFLIQTNERTN